MLLSSFETFSEAVVTIGLCVKFETSPIIMGALALQPTYPSSTFHTFYRAPVPTNLAEMSQRFVRRWGI